MRFLPLFLCASVVLPSLARGEQVVLSEIMYHPADTRPEYLEIWNITNTPIDFTEWRLSEGVAFTFPNFNAGASQDAFLKPMERIVVTSTDPETARAAYGISPTVRVFGPWTGSLDNAGERVTLDDKNGVPLCSVKYGNGGRWAKSADGAGHSLVLRNENNPIDSFHNWRPSRDPGGTPGGTEFESIEAFPNPEVAAATGAAMTQYDSTWKYLIPVTDPGTTWRDPGFDDSSWGSGPGLLGVETAAVPPPGMQTLVDGRADGRITYLFRTTFNYNGSTAGVGYAIDQIVDDGVAYYLNGQLLDTVGLAATGPWDRTAARTVGDATEEPNVLAGAAPSLVQGVNTLAAEVHQTNTGSSDLVFGARFKLSGPATVVINEVKPGVAGNGFVEFFNVTGAPVNLNGYYLSDTDTNLTKYQITTNLAVPANSFATVGFAESNLAVAATTRVYLTSPDGITTVNAIVANMPVDGRSLGRDPAGSTSWFLFSTVTPGAPNGGGEDDSGIAVRLNELHFAVDGTVDWVEVQNFGATAQSLTGLSIASSPDFLDQVPLTGNAAAGRFCERAGHIYAKWERRCDAVPDQHSEQSPGHR